MPNERGWKIKEWCQMKGIKIGTYYNMRKKGRGPKVTDIGVGGPRILPADDRQWEKDRQRWAKSNEAKKADERRSAQAKMAGLLAAKSPLFYPNRKKRAAARQAAE